MNVTIQTTHNPIFTIAASLDAIEITELERWMSAQTDVRAPDCYKELLVAIRKAIAAQEQQRGV